MACELDEPDVARMRGTDDFRRVFLSLARKNAATVTSSGERSGSLAPAENKLEDHGYASTSDRREMATVAMRDGFAKAPRWEPCFNSIGPAHAA